MPKGKPMPREKMDLEKFMTDPAFKDEREFFEGFFTKLLEKKEAEAKRRKAEDDAKNPPTIFDRLFGGE
jgi:hypothetical protein